MKALRHDAAITHANLSADGRFVITADATQARVWRLPETSSPHRVFPLDSASLGNENAAAIAADGSWVALGAESEVRVVSTETGDVARRIPVTARPQTLRFLRDGTLAIGLHRHGLHLQPPGDEAPALLGSKTASVQRILGTEARLCVRESVAKWRLLPRGATPKPTLISEWHVDCSDDTVVAARDLKISVRRGKAVVEATVPSKIVALAIHEASVVVVTLDAVRVLALADLTPLCTLPGAFDGIECVDVAAGRALLWGHPVLKGAPTAATLVDLSASSEDARSLGHTHSIVDVAWLDGRLVTSDARGHSFLWGDAGGEPRALDTVAELPRRWRVRTGLESPFATRPTDALEVAGGILGAFENASVQRALEGGVAAPLPVPPLGYEPARLERLDARRVLAWAEQSALILEGDALDIVQRALGGARVCPSADGSFVARLAHGHVSLHATAWLRPHLALHALDGRVVDIALAPDDALIAATDDGELRVMSLDPWTERARRSLGKRVRRIAVRPGALPVVVGVAFADGTATTVELEPYGDIVREGPRIAARWEVPMAKQVHEELARLCFEAHAETTSVSTPVGRFPLPRYLRELLARRTKRPLHGNSPAVWADVPSVVAFYRAVWSAAATPRDKQVIDLGDVHFAGEPLVAFSENDGAPFLQLASVRGGEVLWTIAAREPDATGDPYVTFFHPATGKREMIERLSEILYRLT